MRKIVAGKEVVILEEDGYGGFQSIEVEKLHKKVNGIFSEDSLLEMEATGNFPSGLRNMPLIALIKSNIGGNNSMGWKRHQQKLKDEGFDV